MFTSLTVSIETSFKLSLLCGNNKTSVICNSCSHNHIGYIILVAWSIKDCHSLLFSIKVCSSNFNSLALSSLLLALIHSVGQPPRLSVLFLGLFLELSDGTLIHNTHSKHDVSANS